MNKQKTIWVMCGGVSTEHEISVLSAKKVVEALFPLEYKIAVVFISKQSQWYYCEDALAFVDQSIDVLQANSCLSRLAVVPGSDTPWFLVDSQQSLRCDCVFSLLHGTQGEDGCIQGVLNVLDVPFVGADVLGSAVCMAKHVAKSLLRSAGIATPPWVTLTPDTRRDCSWSELQLTLGNKVFVKPSRQGSSVGVSKVDNAAQFESALDEAFCYDDVVLLEQAITGREIECSVLGNQQPQVSLPGEIVTQHDFYSYSAKYLEKDAAKIITPANLTPEQQAKLQLVALKSFKLLQCQGLARVDMYLTEKDEVCVNEINTLPGFTEISMYSKNWMESGKSYQELLINLIDLAFERFEQKSKLHTDYIQAESVKT